MIIASAIAGFDTGRWEHWLLIACFGAIATVGLSLSHQWKKEHREKRRKAAVSSMLMRTVHGLQHSGKPSIKEQYRQYRK